MSLLPSDEQEQAVVQKSQWEPRDSTDQPRIWWRFVNGLRKTIGMKPLYLAERWGEAKVTSLETDNQVKILNAQREFELAMAEVRKKDQETRLLGAQARSLEVDVRVKELAAEYIESRSLNPEQNLEKLLSVMSQIECCGGRAEIQPPDSQVPVKMTMEVGEPTRIQVRPGEPAPRDGHFEELGPDGETGRTVNRSKGQILPPIEQPGWIWVAVASSRQFQEG